MALQSNERLQRRICYLLVVLVACPLVINTTTPVWWGLGINTLSVSKCTDTDRCPTCPELREASSITESQEVLCDQDIDPIRAIARGARRAIISCQSNFATARWNCSTFFGDHLFGSFIDDDTRETAVLYALLTAGALSGIGQACHDQEIDNCVCSLIDGPPTDEDGNLLFYACNENIDWAKVYLDRFTSTVFNPTTTLHDHLIEHNSKVGEKAISTTQEQDCICHGISGTCSVQTCYKKSTDLNTIGSQLYVEYEGAIRVRLSDEGNLEPSTGSVELKDTDLVWSGHSPSFCNSDLPRGVLGSVNRTCDPNPNAPDSCSILCCGRGYTTYVYDVPKQKCEFVWCCRIECRIEGIERIEENRCN